MLNLVGYQKMMVRLEDPAAAMLDQLTEGLNEGARARTFLSAEGTFGSLEIRWVDAIEGQEGGALFSLSQGCEAGLRDASVIADPEMLFIHKAGAWYPVSMASDNQPVLRAVTFTANGRVSRLNKSAQRELAEYSTLWMYRIAIRHNADRLSFT